MPKNLNISKAIDARAGAKRKVVGRGKAWHSEKGAGGSFNASPGEYDLTEAATQLAIAWEGYGTGLKPAYEPALLVRKYPAATIAACAERWGTGGIAIDASRVGSTGGTAGADYQKTGLFKMGGKAQITKLDAGRWPANVLLDEEAARQLDAQSGNVKSQPYPEHGAPSTITMAGMKRKSAGGYSDEGGASRFFYTAKAPRGERNAGCEALPVKQGAVGALRDGGRYELELHTRAEVTGRKEGSAGSAGSAHGRAGAGSKFGTRNRHPTVKPIDLARYFARLILPPPHPDGSPRRLLVPFSGSGSEIIGALQAGWDEVHGIEREAEYIEIARARIKRGGVFSKLQKKAR